MKDETVRAISADRGVRVAVIRADQMVLATLVIQNPQHSREVFGQVLMAAVLVRESMAPDQRVQVTLRSEEGAVFADSYPGGITRGIVAGNPIGTTGVNLQVARVLKNGSLQQGIVSVDGLDVAESLEQYMRQSEQVDTHVSLECRELDDGKVIAAGTLAQLLPDGTNAQLQTMKGLANHDDLLTQPAEAMARQLCPGGLILSHHEVGFGCVCSHERVLSAMSAMGQVDLHEVIAEGEPLFIVCEYCQSEYRIAIEELKGLLPN